MSTLRVVLSDGLVRALPMADALLLIGTGMAHLAPGERMPEGVRETAALDGGETPEGGYRRLRRR